MTALLGVGEAVQRFWLEASRLGLAVQPALAILVSRITAKTKTAFSAEPSLVPQRPENLVRAFRQALGDSPEGSCSWAGSGSHCRDCR